MQSSEMYHSLLQSVTAGQLLRWRLVTSTIILVTMDLTYDETNKTETEENKFWTLTGRKHPLSALFQSAGEYAWNARDDSTFCGRIYRHGCASNLQQKLYFIRKWWQNSKKNKTTKKKPAITDDFSCIYPSKTPTNMSFLRCLRAYNIQWGIIKTWPTPASWWLLCHVANDKSSKI